MLIKHSKFKNTGILFELLTRQITADILAGNDGSEAKRILFKYFSENTELGKEYQLYNFLLNEKTKDDFQAEKFINIILKQREKLDNKKLTEQKYSLIRENYADDFLPGLPSESPTNEPASLYSKFLDSASGLDAAGAVVPDPMLPYQVQTNSLLQHQEISLLQKNL